MSNKELFQKHPKVNLHYTIVIFHSNGAVYGGLLDNHNVDEFSLESCHQLIVRTYDEFDWLPFVKGTTYDEVLKKLDGIVNRIKPDHNSYIEWTQDVSDVSRSFCNSFSVGRDMSGHYHDMQRQTNHKDYLEDVSDVNNPIKSDDPDQTSANAKTLHLTTLRPANS